jgi:hypothetical protein
MTSRGIVWSYVTPPYRPYRVISQLSNFCDVQPQRTANLGQHEPRLCFSFNRNPSSLIIADPQPPVLVTVTSFSVRRPESVKTTMRLSSFCQCHTHSYYHSLNFYTLFYSTLSGAMLLPSASVFT